MRLVIVNIQALKIEAGERIFAYCNNKMQICTVRRVLDSSPQNVTLLVSTSERSRSLVSRIVQFRADALVKLVS